jgi:signal transduction histidine kinase
MAMTTSLRHRERFDALRRQMFVEMSHTNKQWGMTGFTLINVLVLVALATGGAPPLRIAIQFAAVALWVPFFIWRMRKRSPDVYGQSLFVSFLIFVVCVANSGGASSPLVIMGIPLLFVAAMAPIRREVRILLFAAFLIAFVAMVFMASGIWGASTAGERGFELTPPIYVALSTAAALCVVPHVYYLGTTMSLLYERVALELGSRREQICDESEGRSRALEGIAARLAHEVKNPLAAIKGLSKHMARNATDPQMAERLGIVAAEADRLQQTVDGFLSFSRGFDELRVEPMRPFELAHELSVLLEVRAGEAGVTLDVTGSTDLELHADRHKLRQVLLNLVLNAIQASERGQSVAIEVRGPSCGGRATISVIDRGSGMSPEIIERIKRPYYTTREGGTGLGVVVARALIEQHGGVLTYQSAPGRGTTAIIDLPDQPLETARARKLPDPSRDPMVPLRVPDSRTPS